MIDSVFMADRMGGKTQMVIDTVIEELPMMAHLDRYVVVGHPDSIPAMAERFESRGLTIDSRGGRFTVSRALDPITFLISERVATTWCRGFKGLVYLDNADAMADPVSDFAPNNVRLATATPGPTLKRYEMMSATEALRLEQEQRARDEYDYERGMHMVMLMGIQGVSLKGAERIDMIALGRAARITGLGGKR